MKALEDSYLCMSRRRKEFEEGNGRSLRIALELALCCVVGSVF